MFLFQKPPNIDRQNNCSMKRILAPLVLIFCAAPAGAIDRPAACVTVFAPPNWVGCGTCVACANGHSLVVTCNHIFSEKDDPEGGFCDDIYPISCTVSLGDLLADKRLPATAVAGDR